MSLIFDEEFQVYKVTGMGPYDNNGYVLADPKAGECYLVDAPAEIERLLQTANRFHIKGVLITHSHPDHIAGYSELKRLADPPIGLHQNDAEKLPNTPDFLLNDNDTLHLGSTPIQVLHTPGHTPGGICLLIGTCLISGDTLFPGGPGYTRSPDDFHQVITSIAERILILDGDTLVLPGHGSNTNVADARRDYTEFSNRNSPTSQIYGHVSWHSP